jgi:hypothetical protein
VDNGGVLVSNVFDTSCCPSLVYTLNGNTTTDSTIITSAGVHEVKASNTKTCYVVLYDTNGGFVSGGGWIMSPAGAYAKDKNMTGKATFAFSARYQKGAKTPDGLTTFVFQSGNFKFKSTKYDWLVVEGGTKAKYKGSGKSKYVF